MSDTATKKIFISYSWRPEGHKAKVLNLTNALRRDRVDCWIDQGVFPQPAQGWSVWTQQQVQNADFIIIVCSPEYSEADKIEGDEELHEPDRPGKGVVWEARFIRKYLYESQGRNKKAIPIAFESGNRQHIPFGLNDYNFYELLDDVFDKDQSKSYEALLRHIYDKPYVQLDELGEAAPDLPPITPLPTAQTDPFATKAQGNQSPPEPAPLLINHLLIALQDAGLILRDDELASVTDAESLINDEDIADAIWLASKITTVDNEVVAAAVEQPVHSSSTVTIETIEAETDEPPASVSAYIPESFQRETPKQQDADDRLEQGLPIQVHAAPALQDARMIARSLRPLMRKVPSLKTSILDETATVNQIAERDIWMPVLKPAPERWLDLELVIECSEFSFIWRSTLDELQQVLERQGAFRNVRTWNVEGVNSGQLRLVPKHLSTEQTSILRSPRELIDVSGRRLVLYVSDCRSSAWQQGQIHDWLKQWSVHQPTAIVHLLPERLWEQSELDVGFGVQVSALMPGVPNQNLLIKELPPRTAVDENQALTLPIVTLTAKSFRQLALVISAVGGQRVAARLFDLSWVSDPYREKSPAVIFPQSPEDRVELFLSTASPTAQRLARLMAAVPVNLSVVHLIQARLLKDSNPVHVAEVYSSGLLESFRQNQSVNDSIQYSFFPGVRKILNETTPEDETIDVLNELSQAIAITLGLPPIKSFTALLSPKSEWTQTTREMVLPFAQVATQVLHHLGGEYAALAETVERNAALKSDWIQPIEPAPAFPGLEVLEFITAQLVEPAAISQFPSLQTQEVEVVTIVFETESEGLERFEFEVATIERRTGAQLSGFVRGLRNLFSGSEQRSDWVIRKQRRQAYQWVERLGDNLQLEMVSIPAGSFLMGSPEDEIDRRSSESPQHEVSVPTFFMGKYPITQAQWRFVAGLPQVNQELDPDPSGFKGDNRPVERVSWYKAVEFCDRLSIYTKREYRLPTEAEWEYACRASPSFSVGLSKVGTPVGGANTPFHFGETITTDLANYDGDDPGGRWSGSYGRGPKGENRGETTPVDHFNIANAFGLCDMHGNVLEWCLDHWHENYEGAPIDGSAWLTENENASRVRRGGFWYGDPRNCRSAYRDNGRPDNQDINIGFRVVCVAPRTL